MYCVHCGKQIKDDARFCSFCGAPVEDDARASAEARAEGADSVEVTRIDVIAPEGERSAGGFAGQMEQDRKRSRRKLSPLMIVALVLALLAGTALAAVLIVQQANQGEQATQQASQQAAQAGQGEGTSGQAQSAESPASSDAQPQPEEFYHHEAGLITVDFPIDWAPPAVNWNNRDHTSGVYIHEGTFADKQAVIVGRFDMMWREGMQTGSETTWERIPSDSGTPGWKIKSGDVEMSFSVMNAAHTVWSIANGGQYAPDLSPDEQAKYLHLTAGDRISVADVTGLSEAEAKVLGEREITAYMEEKVLPRIKLGDQPQNQSSASASSASSSAATPTFDQAKAEAEARSAAESAGKTVLTGTIFIGGEEEWADLEGLPRAPNPGSKFTYVGLVLDEPATVSAHNSDGARAREQPYVERSGTYVLMGSNFNDNAVDAWSPYDGQRVSVAFPEFYSFSDSLGVLFNFSGKSGERIAPLTEADVSTQASAGAPSGDYVLPDSNTRRYSRAELEKMDLHTLFLARNEIFARHGAGFKKQELRDWFGSKPWYHESIPAGSYGTEILNDVEKDNALLMRDVETARNSPYLN